MEGKCPKHGCVITETITDDVFCGVCRAVEKDARIAKLEKFAREFLLYFTSSNGIPVERATIKADSDIVHMALALMERG